MTGSAVLDADGTTEPDPGSAHQAGMMRDPAVEVRNAVKSPVESEISQASTLEFRSTDLISRRRRTAALDGGLARLVGRGR